MTHNCLIHEDNLRKEREIRFSEEKILLLKLYINWFFWKRDIVIFLTLVTTIEIEFVDRYHEMRDMTVEFSLSWIIPQRWSIWISCKQALLRLLSIHVFATVHSIYGNESLSEISVSTWKPWHCLYIYFKQIVFIYIHETDISTIIDISRYNFLSDDTILKKFKVIYIYKLLSTFLYIILFFFITAKRSIF